MKQRLPPAVRELATKVARAGFANPFGEERERVDVEIAGCAVEAGKRLEIVLQKIEAALASVAVSVSCGRRLQAYEQCDARLILMMVLFRTFHKFINAMDSLIGEQIRVGDKCVKVPFKTELVQDLEEWGIERDESLRYMAIFFQMRRAYYFINSCLVGRSSSMNGLRRKLWNNVFTSDMRLYERHLWNSLEDFSTLLVGETGTGKGVAAAAIGRSGYIPFDESRGCFAESFVRSFVAINLSQFPESLIESELFGHKKGAFTGALESHRGILSLCSPHGAIFLDEIGDISIPVQIKLLNVLQERVFSPVGSHEKIRFQGRIIGATNRQLNRLRDKGLLRDDFFYRLCSDVIEVPPLRQRIAENEGEINELMDIIVMRLVSHKAPELKEWILERLERCVGGSYPWPGNVRELEQAARRIILTGEYHPDLSGKTCSLTESLAEGIERGSYTAQELIADYCRLLHSRHRAYIEVARRVGLDRRTVKKYIAGDN